MRRAAVLLLLAGCGQAADLVEREPPPPGLKASPRWLSFTCLEPGCDQALSTTIEVVGRRDVAVKRLLLSDRERTDFTVTPSREPPFVLAAGGSLSVEIRHRPTGDPRLTDVKLLLTYTDASASESDPERIPPGELEVPLVRRLIGEPKLAAEPARLVFGPVAVGSQSDLPLTVKNDGFGNVGLVIDRVEIDPPDEVSVLDLPMAAIVPQARHDLRVRWSPATERFLRGRLKVVGVGSASAPVTVELLGTSIGAPTLGFEPARGVDFGEVPAPSTGQQGLLVTNQGRAPLFLSGVEIAAPVTGGILTATIAGGAATATIASLESRVVSLELTAQAPGPVESRLLLRSSDPARPLVEVPITGLMTQPIMRVDPGSLDFGNVPRGWTVSKSVEITNDGYGALVVSYVGLVVGTATLFTISSVPNLPVSLQHGQRVALEIEFRSEAEAPFTGTLAIDSNDGARPFVEVPLAAVGASCELGCPIANGLPTCTGGVCAIESCNMGFYDSDHDPATGCECREPSTDAGGFCADSVYAGSVSEGSRTSVTGIVPEADDVDIIRFFSYDDTGFFDEDFDVNVTLDSADPGVRLCVYRHRTDNHLNECFLDDESCPQGRHYRDDGSFGTDDSADYMIKIFRDPASPPTCTPYAVFIRNG